MRREGRTMTKEEKQALYHLLSVIGDNGFENLSKSQNNFLVKFILELIHLPTRTIDENKLIVRTHSIRHHDESRNLEVVELENEKYYGVSKSQVKAKEIATEQLLISREAIELLKEVIGNE
jgi:hypothetical protein